MEASIQMEHLGNGGTMAESIVIGQECAVEDGIPAGAMNGQLEIEIPAGDARQGAIHTIQLQSPGGNTHIVEGLVVSNAAHGGEADGVVHSETALFHSGSGGTFLLPTSHANSLGNSTLIASPSGEIITSDGSDHHILSGLQVVRVTTGENCETIFLVPANGGGKDGMQQVMVLQPAEDMVEEQSQIAGEVVEEEAVELNIPSPKPILTTVKQEVDGEERTIVVSDHSTQQFESSSNAPTTLVVVTGEQGNSTMVAGEDDAKPVVSVVDKKPVLPATQAINGHTSTKPPPPKPVIGIAAANDDRPKRKAAIKATATRKAVLASLTSPRKSSSSPKSPKKNAKPTVQVTHTPPEQKSVVVTKPVVGSPKKTSIQVVPSVSVVRGGNTVTVRAQPPPPPFIRTVPAPVIQNPPPPPLPGPRIIFAGGNPIHTAPRGYFIKPEDIVSDSDDEGEGPPLRKCVICLRRRRFTENVFDPNRPNEPTSSNYNATSKQQLVQNLDMLLAHMKIPLNIQAIKKKPQDLGICTSCLDSLQRWHVFTCAIIKRHETVTSSGVSFDDSPVNWEPFETRVYRNFRKMTKVKEVYHSATHSHLIRRNMTEKDWDFFCDHLFRSNSLKSERARELERYIMSRERLTQIFCVKCQRLVKNGKKGFIKHIRAQHPQDAVLIPCDICGNHFPEKDAPPNTEGIYPHWISHFYFNSCEDCGKKFPTKRLLGQHRQTAHQKIKGPAQWKNIPPGEDRPWKCEQCDASFKMKGALVSHRDVVHYNRKNHVCNICGEAFKSASSLRGHVRRHEGRRDYKCEVCHKEYYTYSALKGHKVVHQTARDFICGICGKAFKKKKALEEHGTLHTGVKPHRCPICGREIRVKSNLYKHMKIHKKNAELGIPGGRGRHSTPNSNSSGTSAHPKPGSSNNSTITLHVPTPTTSSAKPSSSSRASPSKPKTKNEPKVKVVKVENRQLIIKEEPAEISPSFPQPSNLNSSPIKMSSTSSPIQGATPVDVVLENAEIPGQEHRGPIVVSIVTDGLGGGPANILHMNQDQQQQLLNVVTSLANSHGQSVTVAGPSGATFIASPMQGTVSSGTTTVNRNTHVATTGSSSGGRTEEHVITVPTTTQYYTTQHFFNSLDHLPSQ